MSPKIDYELNRRANEILKRLEEEMDSNKRDELSKELDKLRDEIRENHNTISKWFVENNDELKETFEEKNFEDYIEVLGFIVETHRFDPIDIFKCDDKAFFEDLNVRPSLIAFMLELADDMDIGYWRVDTKRFEVLARYLGSENIKHIFLNKKVKLVEKRNVVVYKVRIPSVEEIGEKNFAELMGLLLKWWEKIETRIDRAKLYGGNALGKWKEILSPKVEFDVSYFSGSSIAKVNMSKRFEVDKSLLADLLSGEVYGNNWEFAFRELISNAFDAIKRRWAEGDRFSPKIFVDVEFEDDWTIITIEDNGIGMSPRDVEDYLLRVGRSFYRELREKDRDFAGKICPIGYYGIGFLSCFMLLKNNGDFEGSIEVESKKKGYDAVKILIFNPNLPVIWMKTDRDVGTTVRVKYRREDIRMFFKRVLEYVMDRNTKVFPFSYLSLGYGIVSSIFEKLNLRIPIEVKINGVIVWDGVIEPYFGEVVEEVETRDGRYKLKIFLIGEDNIIVGPRAVVNGIRCDIVNRQFELFKLFNSLAIDGERVYCILNVEAENARFVDLAKKKVELPKEIVGELFRKMKDKLKRKRVYLDMIDPTIITDMDFEEVRAMEFVKSCLRFKSIYGEFKSLEEIEKEGKKPIVVNIDFFEKFKNEFKNFWEKKKLYPLESSPKGDHFLTTCQKVNDLFEKCEVCENCIFSGEIGWVWKIKDEDLKEFLLENFRNVVAIENTIRNIFIKMFLMDNPFVKQICEEWRIGNKEIKKLVEKIEDIAWRKIGVAVEIEDIEELVKDDEELEKLYEKIKSKMGD
ncbi:MAG: hypothetical protein DRJ35_08480 [Thermoprotei archaeon]|nr:MAG: hypothetical protein DRJ35_08480 [Thermoprotei archaeon]